MKDNGAFCWSRVYFVGSSDYEEVMEMGVSRKHGDEKSKGAGQPAAGDRSSNGHGHKKSAEASPQRKTRPVQKRTGKHEAGGEIASPRQQVGPGSPKPEMQKQYRK